MSRKRIIGTRAALGGLTAAAALIAAQPAAKADEVADLRANQELLQQRLDQLAQAQGPGNPYGVGEPPGPVNVQMMGGSFPRSFLIPGTDTSIRVGGEIRLLSLFWITGGSPGIFPSTNAGTTGQLNTIPLKGGNDVLRAGRIRGEEDFVMSPQQSKMSVETRTPTAWGEARSFLEFDFAGGTTGVRSLSASSNVTPRLRYAYGTLGSLLFGQANSNFNDSDAGMESLEFGGLIGAAGPSRVGQIRWTQPLADYGLLGALSISAESPETKAWGPNIGVVASEDSPNFTGVASPLKTTAPDIVAAWYIPQPWGHVDFAAVVRPMLRVNTLGIDRTYTGYGFNFSGDVKPRWFGWTGDFFTWNVAGGEAMGRYHYAGTGSTVELVTNLTAATLASNSVLIKPTRGWEGNIAYRHVWSPTLRSNIGAGIWHLDVPGLNGVVCPAADRATAAGGCGLNKELVMGKVNLIWAPVAFVDFGLEYNYGRRLVVSGQNGDEHVVVSRMRLRF